MYSKIETYDWKKRGDALKKVQEIAMIFQDIIENE